MGELRPVLDFESPGINGYPEIPEHEEAVRIVTQFLQAFYQKTNVYPMLYTNLAGISRLAPLDEFLSSKELWIAWYYNQSPNTKIRRMAGLADMAIQINRKRKSFRC